LAKSFFPPGVIRRANGPPQVFVHVWPSSSSFFPWDFRCPPPEILCYRFSRLPAPPVPSPCNPWRLRETSPSLLRQCPVVALFRNASTLFVNCPQPPAVFFPSKDFSATNPFSRLCSMCKVGPPPTFSHCAPPFCSGFFCHVLPCLSLFRFFSWNFCVASVFFFRRFLLCPLTLFLRSSEAVLFFLPPLFSFFTVMLAHSDIFPLSFSTGCISKRCPRNVTVYFFLSSFFLSPPGHRARRPKSIFRMS